MRTFLFPSVLPFAAYLTIVLVLATGQAQADDTDTANAEAESADANPSEDAPTKTRGIELAEGALSLEVSEDWKTVQPRVRIIEHEFAVPSGADEEETGRVTIMVAGGSVEANVDRWLGQFELPEGGNVKEKAEIKEKKIADLNVHRVDVTGTYKDQRGPFAPAVTRADYRMLAAIIQTPQHGNYFIKFYGPKETVGKQEKAFDTMLESLKVR
jgi:hypothetical protein